MSNSLLDQLKAITAGKNVKAPSATNRIAQLRGNNLVDIFLETGDNTELRNELFQTLTEIRAELKDATDLQDNTIALNKEELKALIDANDEAVWKEFEKRLKESFIDKARFTESVVDGANLIATTLGEVVKAIKAQQFSCTCGSGGGDGGEGGGGSRPPVEEPDTPQLPNKVFTTPTITGSTSLIEGDTGSWVVTTIKQNPLAEFKNFDVSIYNADKVLVDSQTVVPAGTYAESNKISATFTYKIPVGIQKSESYSIEAKAIGEYSVSSAGSFIFNVSKQSEVTYLSTPSLTGVVTPGRPGDVITIPVKANPLVSGASVSYFKTLAINNNTGASLGNITTQATGNAADIQFTIPTNAEVGHLIRFSITAVDSVKNFESTPLIFYTTVTAAAVEEGIVKIPANSTYVIPVSDATSIDVQSGENASLVMPESKTLPVGHTLTINNNGSQPIEVKDANNTVLTTVPASGSKTLVLLDSVTNQWREQSEELPPNADPPVPPQEQFPTGTAFAAPTITGPALIAPNDSVSFVITSANTIAVDSYDIRLSTQASNQNIVAVNNKSTYTFTVPNNLEIGNKIRISVVGKSGSERSELATKIVQISSVTVGNAYDAPKIDAPVMAAAGQTITIKLNGAPDQTVDHFELIIGNNPKINLTTVANASSRDFFVPTATAIGTTFNIRAVAVSPDNSRSALGEAQCTCVTPQVKRVTFIKPTVGQVVEATNIQIETGPFEVISPTADTIVGSRYRILDNEGQLCYDSGELTSNFYNKTVVVGVDAVTFTGSGQFIIQGMFKGERLGWSPWNSVACLLSGTPPLTITQPLGGDVFRVGLRINTTAPTTGVTKLQIRIRNAETNEEMLVSERPLSEDNSYVLTSDDIIRGNIPLNTRVLIDVRCHSNALGWSLYSVASACKMVLDWKDMPNYRVFTESGTFTVPDDVTSIGILCIAPGGEGQAGAAGGAGENGIFHKNWYYDNKSPLYKTLTGGSAGVGGIGGKGGPSVLGRVNVTPSTSLNITIGALTSVKISETTLVSCAKSTYETIGETVSDKIINIPIEAPTADAAYLNIQDVGLFKTISVRNTEATGQSNLDAVAVIGQTGGAAEIIRLLYVGTGVDCRDNPPYRYTCQVGDQYRDSGGALGTASTLDTSNPKNGGKGGTGGNSITVPHFAGGEEKSYCYSYNLTSGIGGNGGTGASCITWGNGIGGSGGQGGSGGYVYQTTWQLDCYAIWNYSKPWTLSAGCKVGLGGQGGQGGQGLLSGGAGGAGGVTEHLGYFSMSGNSAPTVNEYYRYGPVTYSGIGGTGGNAVGFLGTGGPGGITKNNRTFSCYELSYSPSRGGNGGNGGPGGSGGNGANGVTGMAIEMAGSIDYQADYRKGGNGGNGGNGGAGCVVIYW